MSFQREGNRVFQSVVAPKELIPDGHAWCTKDAHGARLICCLAKGQFGFRRDGLFQPDFGFDAACLQAGMPMARAMKRASIAASLTCTKEGSQKAFPFLADIDERINDLDDPVQI